MSIKRTKLVNAINTAHKDFDLSTYEELLRLYYKLLEQEDISDKFITEFITYEHISEPALKLIKMF